LWLGTFRATRGRVLVIDNELHPETYSVRSFLIADALGIPRSQLHRRITTMQLRGRLMDIATLRTKLVRRYRADRFLLIILDALYRFYPSGISENDNAAMTKIYNELDGLARDLNCAVANVHHASKGSQADKSITDVGSGAGSLSRACDTHLVLREHEEPDAVVLEAAVRSFPPVAPLALRWSFPLWTPATDLNPDDLKRPPTYQDRQKGESEEKFMAAFDPALADVRKFNPQLDTVSVSQVAKVAGMKLDTAQAAVGRLVHQKKLERCTIKATVGNRMRDDVDAVRRLPVAF
jgi:hypothetical protein